jgi:hypothetical protein
MGGFPVSGMLANWTALSDLVLESTGLSFALPDLRSFPRLQTFSIQYSVGISSATTPFSLLDPATPASNPLLQELSLAGMTH